MSQPQGAIVLLYHRVTKLSRDPQLLCVSPERFRQQIEVLRNICPIVPLSEIVDDLRCGRPIHLKAAITFDDGYADNLMAAAPILRQFSAPATVFSTAGRDERAGEFFWDALDQIFLSPGQLPSIFELQTADGSTIRSDLGRYADYDRAEAEAFRCWTVLDPANPTPRHQLYHQLCGKLHPSPLSQREQLFHTIRQWAGMDVSIRPTHRMMSLSELNDLSADGLIEIGGHTTDHPRLSCETLEVQAKQIKANRNTLFTATGNPPIGFAYPFGTRRDYTPSTISLLREAGYQYACSNFTGRVGTGTDCFQIPRYIVRNWTVEEFEQRFRTWVES